MRLRRLCTTATLAVALLAPAAAPAAADQGPGPLHASLEDRSIRLDPQSPGNPGGTQICPGELYGNRCEEFTHGGGGRDGLLLRLEFEPGAAATPMAEPAVRVLDAGCIGVRFVVGATAETTPAGAVLVVVHTTSTGQVTERRIGTILFRKDPHNAITRTVSDEIYACSTELSRVEGQVPPT